MPAQASTLAVRWTGFSNIELVYNGRILLLDAYIDRGRMYPALGYKAEDVKKVDAILLGHGHFDHMSDAASIASRTGALVAGAPVTTEKLSEQKLDPKQIKTVTGRGGETFTVGPFTIEPILGRHGEPPATIVDAFEGALRRTAKQPTEEELAEQKLIRERGTFDKRVITEGTIAYLITLDNGFRVMYRNSGGRVTEFEKAAAARAGKVDLMIGAIAASFLNSLTSEQALEYLETWRPDVYMPAHHDAANNGLWRAIEPVFQSLKDRKPELVTISKTYREPTCFDTRMKIGR
jgi:L-ascorbate metabolism protein UlaG (beta-lactamase superfamily)